MVLSKETILEHLTCSMRNKIYYTIQGKRYYFIGTYHQITAEKVVDDCKRLGLNARIHGGPIPSGSKGDPPYHLVVARKKSIRRSK